MAPSTYRFIGTARVLPALRFFRFLADSLCLADHWAVAKRNELERSTSPDLQWLPHQIDSSAATEALRALMLELQLVNLGQQNKEKWGQMHLSHVSQLFVALMTVVPPVSGLACWGCASHSVTS